MWKCKESCSLTSKLLKERSGVYSTPDDSFRETQTKYLRLRIALDTLYVRSKDMCESASVYAENLFAVAQSLIETPLCLEDREERQEFSRRAAKMFDQTRSFSDLLQKKVLQPLKTKLELFSAQEQGLSARRERKVEFDKLNREIRQVQDSTKSVREKIMRTIVDANKMDSMMRKELPDEMARLEKLEYRKQGLESRLNEDTKTMTTVLSTMENQSLSLSRDIFGIVTEENKNFLERATQVFTSKASTRRRETIIPKVKPPRVKAPAPKRLICERKEFQRSTKSILRTGNDNIRGKLKKALGVDVGVGICTVGSVDRPISTIGSPLPPPRSSSKKSTKVGDLVRITKGRHAGAQAKIVRQGKISSRWKLRLLRRRMIRSIEYPQSKFEHISSSISEPSSDEFVSSKKKKKKIPPPLPSPPLTPSSSPRTPPPLPISKPKTKHPKQKRRAQI